MTYNSSNPLFEFDIYRESIGKGLRLFISIFRYAISIPLTKNKPLSYDAYLDGNYSEYNEDDTDEWFDEDGTDLSSEELELGMTYPDEEEEEKFHPLDGIYYCHSLGKMVEVTKRKDRLFIIKYEDMNCSLLDLAEEIEVLNNIRNESWEFVIKP
jgi:hypothetical protein